MRKFVLLLLLVVLLGATAYSQETARIYDPEADAAAEVEQAIRLAGLEDKHVLVMVGGNWCSWCRRLNAFILEDQQIDSLIQAEYIWVKVNYSKENKNLDLLEDLGLPQRMGFPVMVILDEEGKRLHTQNSWYLEEDKSYSKDKLMSFLNEWTAGALDPKNYKDYRE